MNENKQNAQRQDTFRPNRPRDFRRPQHQSPRTQAPQQQPRQHTPPPARRPQTLVDEPLMAARVLSTTTQRDRDTRAEREMPIRENKYTPRTIALLCVAGLILLALLSLFFRSSSSTTTNEPVKAAQPTTTQVGQSGKQDEIMRGLSRHMILPEEVPQIMQITNPEELVKQDPFFSGAQQGDVLVMFVKSGKAIIYSQARDILVNVGPIEVRQHAQDQAPSDASQTQPAAQQ